MTLTVAKDEHPRTGRTMTTPRLTTLIASLAIIALVGAGCQSGGSTTAATTTTTCTVWSWSTQEPANAVLSGYCATGNTGTAPTPVGQPVTTVPAYVYPATPGAYPNGPVAP